MGNFLSFPSVTFPPKKMLHLAITWKIDFLPNARAFHVFFCLFGLNFFVWGARCVCQSNWIMPEPGFVQLPDSCWRCCLLFLNYIKYLKHMQI